MASSTPSLPGGSTPTRSGVWVWPPLYAANAPETASMTVS
jgi:hypothetical protein